jgi:hypothetical protein
MMSIGRSSRRENLLWVTGYQAHEPDQDLPSRTTSGPAAVTMAAPTGQTHDSDVPSQAQRARLSLSTRANVKLVRLCIVQRRGRDLKTSVNKL